MSPRPATQEAAVEEIFGLIMGDDIALVPLAVVGDSGSGKSTLRLAVQAKLESRNHPMAVIDCWRLRTPRRVELISDICSQLPGGHIGIDDALTIAFASPGEGARAFDRLRETLRDLVQTLDHPVVLIDGFQQLPDSLRKWLVRELRQLGGSLRLVIFTESPTDVIRSEVLEMPRLQTEDVRRMASAHDVSDLSERLALRVLELSQGNASQAMLCLTAGQQGFDLDNPAADLGSAIDTVLSTISAPEIMLLRLATEFVVHPDVGTLERVNRALGTAITPNDVEHLKSLALLADSADGEPLRVAAAAADQVLTKYPRTQILSAARALYESAGERLLNRLTYEDLDLVLIRLQYELAVDQTKAVSRMRQLVGRAIQESRLDDANAIVALAERERLGPFNTVRVAHMRARYHIADFDAETAWKLLRGVSTTARDVEDDALLAEQLLLEARCSVNPAPMPHAELFDAVRLLSEARELLPANSVLLSEIHHVTGIALRSIGQSDNSISAFSAAAAVAEDVGDLESALLAMQETVQSFRYLQDLGSARAALRTAFEFNGEHSLGGNALLDYYSANLLRDEGKPEQARPRYFKASRKLELAGDDYGLCCLLGDWAWLEYLEGDFLTTRQLLDDSLALSTRYRFGTEIAEYWHSRFHLARDEGDLVNARDYVARGAEEARAASNIYMILDCGMHTAEFHRMDQDPHRIRLIVDEMRALERRGCGIRVFRGRTQVIFAASLYENGDHGPAYDAYLEGLETVALFGNSRSNVETFDDILQKHAEAIVDLMDKYGFEQPRARWIDLELADRFPQFLAMCDAAETLSNGGQ